MPKTRRGYEYPDGQSPVRTHGDIEALAKSVEVDVDSFEARGNSTRAVADNGLATARDALEVALVRAQVVDGGIVTVSGVTGSIALDNTVIAVPTSGRTSGSPTRVVAAYTGYYNPKARAVWEGINGATGRRIAHIRKNAAGNPSSGSDLSHTVDQAAAGSGAAIAQIDAGLIFLNAGEYAELFVAHSQGSGVRVLGGAGGTFLSLELVRRTA